MQSLKQKKAGNVITRYECALPLLGNIRVTARRVH